MNNNKIYFKGTEPDIVETEIEREYIKENGIEKYITGNLLAKNKKGDTFEYVSWNFFLDYPPFFNKNKADLEFINTFDFKYKVLCYNRRAHAHRKILVYNILKDRLLKDNTLFSLGYEKEYNDKVNIESIAGYTEDLNQAKNIFEYFTELKEDISFDKNLNLYRDSPGLLFKIEDHQKTFVSLVTETLVENDKLFFSEKTYKPILAQQPFIIMGNPNSLKYLKSIGFKTFDRWWDESYDEETNFKIRFEKILNVVRKICSMSYDELYTIRKELESVCIHNYKHYLKSSGVTEELKKLGFTPQIYQNINRKFI